MFFLYILLLLMLNLGLGFAVASFVGMGPTIRFRFGGFVWFRRRKADTTTFAALAALDDYQVAFDLGRALQDQRRDSSELSNHSWIEVGRVLIQSLESLILEIDLSHQRMMILRSQCDEESWRGFIDSAGNELIARAAAFTEQKSNLRNSDQTELFEGLNTDLKYVQVLVRKNVEQWKKLAFDATDENRAFELYKELLHTFAVELQFRVRELEIKFLTRAMHKVCEDSGAELDSWSESFRAFVQIGSSRILAVEQSEQGGAATYFGLLQFDRVIEAGDTVGRATIRLAIQLLFDHLSRNADAYRIRMASFGDSLLVWGNGSDIDDFASRVDQIRQQVEKTKIDVGLSQFHLTTTCMVKPDDTSVEMPQLLSELLHAYTDLMIFGGNRTFLLDREVPTPILPAPCQVQNSCLAIG